MPETPDLYAQSYEKFLAHTNEKQVFIDEISGYIDHYAVTSVLDIGAGNGKLAGPIAELVSEYTAVEQNPTYAQRLRDMGLRAIEGSFPGQLQIKGQYDLVIVSHVISYELGTHAQIIPAAWDLVAPDGHLLVVSHRGSEQDDWGRVLDAINLGVTERYSVAFTDILTMLRERGETEVRKVVTTLDTADVKDMVQAMAFVASNGTLDRYSRFMDSKSKIETILREQYRTSNGYSFPFLHIFMSTSKA